VIALRGLFAMLELLNARKLLQAAMKHLNLPDRQGNPAPPRQALVGLRC